MKTLSCVAGLAGCLAYSLPALAAPAAEVLPPFQQLLDQPVRLRPELQGVHPRVFFTAAELESLRQRAHGPSKEAWNRALADMPALQAAPPPAPGPQARRGQNKVALALAGVALAWQVERKPEYLAAAKQWLLAAIDYEPWGYVSNKPNTDLAAGQLLYAVGWAYDLLYQELSVPEREQVKSSLERHARLVYRAFAPAPGKQWAFTQNHDFIPTAGLAVAALALLDETPDARQWAALARAHQHRAGTLLSPDGFYYEGFEYWIFASPWLVHFLDAWEHSTGESLWDRGVYRNWKYYVAHTVLPNGQDVFDFGDVWEGSATRARDGNDTARVFPGNRLQSNFNVLYRVAARFQDPETQAVAQRLASLGHSNQEEFWTVLWQDPALRAAPMDSIPLEHHFADSGVVAARTSWNADATAVAFKAGPPQGHRITALLAHLPEARLDSGHAHPDAGSFIVWAHGRYLTGDTGYAGIPSSSAHNTLTFDGLGQGVPDSHDVFRKMVDAKLDQVRIKEASWNEGSLRVVAELGAAYPDSVGLQRFTRTFTWDGQEALSVQDQVELNTPRVVQWRLQSDGAFAPRQGAYQNGGAHGPGVEVSFCTPPDLRVTPEFTVVKTPGPPGRIETGADEERGYQLLAATPQPVTQVELEARLQIQPPAGPAAAVGHHRAPAPPRGPACNPARTPTRPR